MIRLILDLDGVIYRGEEALPYACAFFAFLHRRGVPYVLLTNNSTRTPDAVVDKLRGIGIAVPAARVVTSAEVTAAHVARAFPGERVYAVGEEGLRRALAERGCRLVGDGELEGASEGRGVVVVGLDTSLTYGTLARATALLQQGAPFIATNLDASFPLPSGRIAPGAGALVAALEVTTGRAATVLGKPETPIFEEAVSRLNEMAASSVPGDTWVVGDRLDTDIVGARRAGLRAALVLTGVTGEREAAAAADPPDVVAADLRRLARHLLGAEIGNDV